MGLSVCLKSYFRVVLTYLTVNDSNEVTKLLPRGHCRQPTGQIVLRTLEKSENIDYLLLINLVMFRVFFGFYHPLSAPNWQANNNRAPLHQICMIKRKKNQETF